MSSIPESNTVAKFDGAPERDMVSAEPGVESSPNRNTTLQILHRWRFPIGATLILAAVVHLSTKIGILLTVQILGALVGLPILIYGVSRFYHRMPLVIAGVFIAIVGTVALAQFAELPAALGISLLSALAVITQVWRFKLQQLMILVVLIAVVLQACMLYGRSLLVLGVFAIPPLLIIGVYLGYYRRKSYEREALVEAMALAARSHIPLGPAAVAFASLCSPGFQKQVQKLAKRLDQGQPLHAALQAEPAVATGETMLYAKLGNDWSMLDRSLQTAIDSNQAWRADRVSIWRVLGYPFFVLATVVSGSQYLMYKIFPRIVLIAQEFGLSWTDPALGPLTWVMGPRFNAGYYSIQLFSSVLMFLIVLGGLLCGLFSLLNSTLGCRLPTFGMWARRKRESTAALRGLALGLDQNRPLTETLEDIRNATPSLWVRRRLDQVRRDISLGRTWPQSLHKRGLIGRAERSVLTAAERVGNLPWAVREMAAALDRRSAQRLRLLGVFLQPLALLAVGAFVLTIALAYFLPILAILQRLAEDIA